MRCLDLKKLCERDGGNIHSLLLLPVFRANEFLVIALETSFNRTKLHGMKEVEGGVARV